MAAVNSEWYKLNMTWYMYNFCLSFGALKWHYQAGVSNKRRGSGVMNFRLICWHVTPYHYHYEKLMTCKAVCNYKCTPEWIQRHSVYCEILKNFNQSIQRGIFESETRESSHTIIPIFHSQIELKPKMRFWSSSIRMSTIFQNMHNPRANTFYSFEKNNEYFRRFPIFWKYC